MPSKKVVKTVTPSKESKSLKKKESSESLQTSTNVNESPAKNRVKVAPLITKIDESFTNLHQNYKDLHNRFDVFRGKKLNTDETVAVLQIFDEMKKVYKELNTIMNFVSVRYKECVSISNHFNGFLNQLKGAVSIKGK